MTHQKGWKPTHLNLTSFFLQIHLSNLLERPACRCLSMGLPMSFLDTNKPAFTHMFHSSFLVWPAGHLDGSQLPPSSELQEPQRLHSLLCLARTFPDGWRSSLSPLPRHPPCSSCHTLSINVPEIWRKEGVDRTPPPDGCCVSLTTQFLFPTHQMCLDIFNRARK